MFNNINPTKPSNLIFQSLLLILEMLKKQTRNKKQQQQQQNITIQNCHGYEKNQKVKIKFLTTGKSHDKEFLNSSVAISGKEKEKR